MKLAAVNPELNFDLEQILSGDVSETWIMEAHKLVMCLKDSF